MKLDLQLRSVSTIKITKNVHCKDCETHIPINAIAYNVYYSGQTVNQTRIVCGCCDIPCKISVELVDNTPQAVAATEDTAVKETENNA